MTFTQEWRRTLAGLALVILAAFVLAGCEQQPVTNPDSNGFLNAPGPQNIPLSEPREPATRPATRADIEGGPPAGAEDGWLGDPGVEVDLRPQVNRDPNWDCSPTGNSSIDTWKRNAKCGGRLDGE